MSYSAFSYPQQEPSQPYGGQYTTTVPQDGFKHRHLPPPPDYYHQQGAAPRVRDDRKSPIPDASYGNQHRTPSPAIGSYNTPTEAEGGIEDDGIPKGSIYAQNKAKFDNPLAHNEDWSPTEEDRRLRQLPKIDFALRVKARLTRSAGKPFEPEPRSFQRPPRLSSAAGQHFTPIILQSDGKTGLIGAGFKPNYFGPLMTAHDVSAADYARFLEDIFTAGKVSGAGQLVANVAPLTMHMGVTGYFVTKAIVKGLARRNEPLVVETIETWQERFFGPRGLDVYAAFRGERATAKHVGLSPEPLSGEVAAMANSSSSHGKDRKKDRKKDKDARPILVIAPLANPGFDRRFAGYGRYC